MRPRGGETLVGTVVVGGDAREHRPLLLLAAAGVIDHPVPAGRDCLEPADRRLRVEYVQAHRIRRLDERAQAGQLEGAAGVEHDGDGDLRAGPVVAVAVVQRLDDMANRVAVDEVDQQPPLVPRCHNTTLSPGASGT